MKCMFYFEFNQTTETYAQELCAITNSSCNNTGNVYNISLMPTLKQVVSSALHLAGRAYLMMWLHVIRIILVVIVHQLFPQIATPPKLFASLFQTVYNDGTYYGP